MRFCFEKKKHTKKQNLFCALFNNLSYSEIGQQGDVLNRKSCLNSLFPSFTMAEGDYYTMGNRQRIPRDPFREQSLASRFMEDDFGLSPFPDELSMEWPGWARPRLSARLDAPWSGSLRTGFPRASMGSPQGFSSMYSESPRRSSAPPTNPDEPWKVCVNVHSFKPEELNVKTKDGFIEVSGEKTLLIIEKDELL